MDDSLSFILLIFVIISLVYVFFFSSSNLSLDISSAPPSQNIKSSKDVGVSDKISISTWGEQKTSNDPIFVYLNEIRKEHNLQPYIYDPRLASLAKTYAEKLAAYETMSHSDPVTGENVYDRLDKAHIFYLSAGEVLALVSVSNNESKEDIGRKIVDMWVQSPTHRAIVLESEGVFTHAGFSTVCRETNGTNLCYAVGIVISKLYSMHNVGLSPNQAAFVKLYDKKNLPVKVNVDLKASSDVCAYIVDTYGAFINWSAGKEFYYKDMSCGRSISLVSDIRKGYGIIVSNKRDISTVFTLKVYYDIHIPTE